MSRSTEPAPATVPMLHVTLPTEIMLPATADINALLRILIGAREINEVTSAEIDGNREYAGVETYYGSGPVVPRIRELPAGTLHADKAAAIAAKIEIIKNEKRADAAWLARHAAENPAAANEKGGAQ